MSTLYTFGNATDNALGIGYPDVEVISELNNVDGIEGKVIKSFSCGRNHVGVVTVSGELYTWGNNDFGQLGRVRKVGVPQRVEYMDSQFVVDVRCGDYFTLILTKDNKVFSCGRNNFGQLGYTTDDEVNVKPRIIKQLSDKHVVRIACGLSHCLALSGNNRSVWSWGRNHNGQTGRDGESSGTIVLPVQDCLSIPVKDVFCGSNSSFLLTELGHVLSFGCNEYGELGLSDTQNRTSPQFVPNINNIVKFSAGNSHSLALDSANRLYSWGRSSYGELGYFTDEPFNSTPRIINFEGEIVDLSCGGRHSLIATYDMHYKLYGFGSGNKGQLSTRTNSISNIQPLRIDLPDMDFSQYETILLNAGDLFSAVAFTNEREEDIYFEKLEIERVKEIIHEPVFSERKLAAYLSSRFSWPAVLNGSLISHSSNLHNTVDLPLVRELYRIIFQIKHVAPKILEIINKAIIKCLSKFKSEKGLTNPETLRFFLILFEHPTLQKPNRLNLTLFENLCVILANLSQQEKDILCLWWSEMHSEYFIRIVKVVLNFLKYVIRNGIDIAIVHASKVLSDLHHINEMYEKIPNDQFYIDDILDHIDLEQEYKRWLSGKNVFSILRYPILLNNYAKRQLILLDAHIQMSFYLQNAVHSTMQGNLQLPNFVLAVRREYLIEDTLSQISSVPPHFFKKPLKVQFIGEDGVDEGGVRKEFFQLLLEQLFDPMCDLFSYNEENNHYWFNINSMENEVLYYLTGVLIGLAVYNGVLLTVNFPTAVYKKLLDKELYLHDFINVFGTMGQNLSYVLNFQGDIEDTFGLDFTVVNNVYGEMIEEELLPNGKDIPVTNSNVKKYSELFVEYYLNKSIEKQFAEFKKGFLLVADSPVFSLLHAEELKLCTIGQSIPLDFKLLQEITTYNDYTKDHPTILNFWEVVHNLSPQERKQLLLFVRGTDRIPLGGARDMKFVIQRNGGDSDFLPTAVTCYNTILLPEYTTLEKMKSKLRLALENCYGFGLA